MATSVVMFSSARELTTIAEEVMKMPAVVYLVKILALLLRFGGLVVVLTGDTFLPFAYKIVSSVIFYMASALSSPQCHDKFVVFSAVTARRIRA